MVVAAGGQLAQAGCRRRRSTRGGSCRRGTTGRRCVRPSGDQRGRVASCRSSVSRRDTPPAAGVTQIAVTRSKASHFPSGETATMKLVPSVRTAWFVDDVVVAAAWVAAVAGRAGLQCAGRGDAAAELESATPRDAPRTRRFDSVWSTVDPIPRGRWDLANLPAPSGLHDPDRRAKRQRALACDERRTGRRHVVAGVYRLRHAIRVSPDPGACRRRYSASSSPSLRRWRWTAGSTGTGSCAGSPCSSRSAVPRCSSPTRARRIRQIVTAIGLLMFGWSSRSLRPPGPLRRRSTSPWPSRPMPRTPPRRTHAAPSPSRTCGTAAGPAAAPSAHGMTGPKSVDPRRRRLPADRPGQARPGPPLGLRLLHQRLRSQGPPLLTAADRTRQPSPPVVP